MQHSEKGILTSYAGSLPRPDALIERNRARQSGETSDEEAYQTELAAAVGEVVARQTAAGITVPGDGEYGKSMGQKVNYGEVMLKIDGGGYSFEAGNVRHEHEWKVWADTTLPDGKVILPGVVSHAPNVVEHPELVADRIVRFAELVERENVIASTDCGLGGRVHSDIGWAKLESLALGAEIATRSLWK